MKNNTSELLKKKQDLEKRKEVQFYLWFTKLTQDEKEAMCTKYTSYLTKESLAKSLFESSLVALKEKNLKQLKENAVLAREMLLNGDYEKAPYDLDPVMLGHVPVISHYIRICNKIGSNDPFIRTVSEELL